MKKFLISTGLLFSMFSASLFADVYIVDKTHSNIGFKVKHMMISNVSGNFNDFNGDIEFDKKTNSLTSLSGFISVASISTDNEKRDAHLKEPDLFDLNKYTSISFKSKSISDNKIIGDLTLKGITKEIVLTIEDQNVIMDAFGKERVGLALTGSINRSEFGLTWNKALESGGVAVSDKVVLNVDLEGILK